MSGLKRRIGAERTLLMLPLNVVVAARVRGPLPVERLGDALERLKVRHRFLSVRVEFEQDGTGYYVDEDVPPCPLSIQDRRDENQWLESVAAEVRGSFPIETGPLVRCSILHSADKSDIILTAHHAISDGRSLAFLLRDLLKAVTEPDVEIEPLPAPPPIDPTTVPEPARANWLVRWFTKVMNRKWRARDERFGQADMLAMHRAYWSQNDDSRLMAFELDRVETQALVTRCRAEGVTVNAALWAAFLAAQHEVQPEHRRHQCRAALAVSTRDKLKVPVGEALGFFASSLSLDLPYEASRSFWDSARDVHARIGKALAKTDLFRMLIADQIHPTLLDSLYFAKYAGLKGALPRKLLRKLKWHRVSYGFAITNVGRVDIPITYGPVEIESMYGPTFFSDVEEKIVGVMTVGGKLSVLFTCNEAATGPGVAEQLAAAARRRLRGAVAHPVVAYDQVL